MTLRAAALSIAAASAVFGCARRDVAAPEELGSPEIATAAPAPEGVVAGAMIEEADKRPGEEIS